MIDHSAIQIAIARCLKHPHVYYKAGDGELEEAKKQCRDRLNLAKIKYTETTNSFIFWQSRLTITEQLRHMIGHSSKAIIGHGRTPTNMDSSRWRKAVKGKYDENGNQA